MTMASGPATVREIRRAQRADGPAAILAIGTANPPTCMSQDEQEIGHQEAIHAPQRGAPILAAHPDFADHALPSLDARVDLASAAVPELAARAASRAIAEWGRPATDITHVVFSTYSGLRATVSRTVLSLSGCSGGGRALHLAKEIAENNRAGKPTAKLPHTHSGPASLTFPPLTRRLLLALPPISSWLAVWSTVGEVLTEE
ncbi:hypothetical protein EJB05_12442, partial [Eragrostis curvula]